MPVFHRVQSGALIVTVDGDFTVDEMVRVSGRGLESEEIIFPAFVVLDLSGTAGLGASSADRLEPIAEFFAGPRAPVAKLAVVAGEEEAAVVVDAATESGLEANAFKSKSDAMDWLLAI